MRNLKSKIKPEKETVIFAVGGPDQEEDFERQKAEYLKKGGNPDANFMMLITRF